MIKMSQFPDFMKQNDEKWLFMKLKPDRKNMEVYVKKKLESLGNSLTSIRNE